jgi:hypothetical protein
MPIPLALALAPSLLGTGVGLAQQGRLRRDLAERQQAAEGQFDRSLQAIRDISFDPSQELRAARMSQLEAGRAIGDSERPFSRTDADGESCSGWGCGSTRHLR